MPNEPPPGRPKAARSPSGGRERREQGGTMNDLLQHPAVQAGLAPFAVALPLSLLLARTRFMAAAVASGLVVLLLLTIGFALEPLTSVRKAILVTFAATAVVLALEIAAQRVGAIAPYCFYGSDASHLLHRAGMEGVVCGAGGRYNTMPDERVDVADYLDAIKIYMLAMLEIAERPE